MSGKGVAFFFKLTAWFVLVTLSTLQIAWAEGPLLTGTQNQENQLQKEFVEQSNNPAPRVTPPVDPVLGR